MPTIETDPTLWARLCVGKDLYLTQACQSIGQLPAIRHNLSPELRSIISDADIATLQKIAAPHHLNLELVQCRASNNLRNAHIDMIAWAIDRGHCVRGMYQAVVEVNILSCILLAEPASFDRLRIHLLGGRLLRQSCILSYVRLALKRL